MSNNKNINQKRLDFQNARTKEKILSFINEKYKDTNDIVNIEDVCTHLHK